jgi:hypothetical protein
MIPYLYEAQHVSGDKPPIIRSLKLHWQRLVFHTWKVVVPVVVGRCQAQYISNKMHQCFRILLLYLVDVVSGTVCA